MGWRTTHSSGLPYTRFMHTRACVVYVNESKAHRHMKRVAQAILKSEGYETSCEVNDGATVIDVLGEKDGDTVVVEVGDLQNERADYLRENFDRLEHIPYDDFGNGSSTSEGVALDRANITVDPDDWETLGEIVGARQKSKTVRHLISAYIAIASE